MVHFYNSVCGALCVCVISFNLPYLSVPPSLATFAPHSSAADDKTHSSQSASSAEAMSRVMSQIIGQMAAGQIVSCFANIHVTHAKLNIYNYYYYILFSRTTWVSQHQKGKQFWILLEQEMMGWQWHQLDHMQIICILLQTDNHASTSPLSFYKALKAQD